MTTNAVVSIENPERSWLWPLLSLWVKLMNPALATGYHNLEDVTFDVCCHGGQRDKATRLKAMPGVFISLAASCPGNRTHLPRGADRSGGKWVYATASEAEYPAVLASKMTAAVLGTCYFRCP